MIADLQAADTGSDGFHYAGGLVAEDHVAGGGEAAVDDAEVRVADAAVLDLHAHLACPRLHDGDIIVDPDRFPDFLEYRCFHVGVLVALLT
ncbi:MAG: hypothetical protein R3E50_11550 [Halioglobus sp.]